MGSDRFLKIQEVDEKMEFEDEMTLTDIAKRFGPSQDMADALRRTMEAPNELFGESPMLTATQVIQANNAMAKSMNEAHERWGKGVMAWEPIWKKVVENMQEDDLQKGRWVRII